MMTTDPETQACTPVPVDRELFHQSCILPYGLTPDHLYRAMVDFIDFLGFINHQLNEKEYPRLESFLMPASFSSMVGEFMNLTIPRYCSSLIKNQYHNGHPDLIPAGMFPNNAIQYAHAGIEVKGSRHNGGWQGHNPESVWLIVFHFDSNTANDQGRGVGPRPFRFKGVYAAEWKWRIGLFPDDRRPVGEPSPPVSMKSA